MHTTWLDAHVALQPLEIKKKIFENKLKILVGENQGIKDICTWKRKFKKQINKSALIQDDPILAYKYISKGNSQIRFKVNDFRPYQFKWSYCYFLVEKLKKIIVYLWISIDVTKPLKMLTIPKNIANTNEHFRKKIKYDYI